MAKYHVNTDGDAAICRATKRECPFGADLHFETREEAAVAAEDYLQHRVDLEEFPRTHDDEFISKQARLYFQQDQALGRGNNPYKDAGVTNVSERRFQDYLRGFQAGIENDADQEPNLEDQLANNPIRPGAGLLDRTAYRLGYARALRMRDSEKTFIDREIRDFNVDAKQGAWDKYENLRFVQNPFKRGDEILLPAGTRYTTLASDQGDTIEKVTTSPQRVKVADSYGNWADGGVGRLYLHPAQISYSNSPNGYWRDVVLTPEILSANGQETYEDVPGGADTYMRPIWDDTRQWKRDPLAKEGQVA